MYIELNELERDGCKVLIRIDRIERVEPRPGHRCAIKMCDKYILVTQRYEQVRDLLLCGK